jgi:O-antigen ligase
MLYVISRTGSRGALISIGVIVFFMFLRASITGKIKVLVAGSLIFLIASVTLPPDLKARYQTFFTEDPEEQAADQTMLDSAVGSATTRKEMLKRSIVMTFHHPLLGVGPGNFPVAENDMARAEGKRRGEWIGTHNSFTEVSSECGIPAFCFYVAVVVLSMKKTHRIYRRSKDSPAWKEIGIHALALNYSLVAFIVTGVFIHAAYTALLPVLAGLTISLVRTAEPLLLQAPDSGPQRRPVGYPNAGFVGVGAR